jgi:hypothetical protein
MARRRALAVIGFVVGVASGCAAISGVDQYQKGSCPGGCDGAAPGDATTGDGSADARPDAGGSDGGNADGGGDGSTGDDAADATANDSGSGGDCGATNTVQNCSACGATCDQTNTSQAACNGASCLYTCKMGFSDCNNGAPNIDGCECATPSCCGNQCALKHANGLGQSFWDCVALNTYDQTQGTEACAAYTGNQNACSVYSCTGGGQNKVVCGVTNGLCACWNFSGSNVGKVLLNNSASCFCPGANDPAWN